VDRQLWLHLPLTLDRAETLGCDRVIEIHSDMFKHFACGLLNFTGAAALQITDVMAHDVRQNAHELSIARVKKTLGSSQRAGGLFAMGLDRDVTQVTE
jgi:predicted ATP-grasp superfamily ATP-dependent carboligase